MKFELLPVFGVMLDLYAEPFGAGRFEKYLTILNGDTKDDIGFPVSGFNPMAKDHVVLQLEQLVAADAEAWAGNTVDKFSGRSDVKNVLPDLLFRVGLNLSDDLKGRWTNRFTSDYDSKFKCQALRNRGFVVPVLWTSEAIDDAVIVSRTEEYCLRCVYQLQHGKLRTLEEHIAQERFALQKGLSIAGPDDQADLGFMKHVYDDYKDETDYAVIFNFLYGDIASESLGMKKYGIVGSFPGSQFAANTNK